MWGKGFSAAPAKQDNAILRRGGQLSDLAVRVCGGHRPPPNAYLAVHYRGYWYYIDDTDRETKATFALMTHLSRLDFNRQSLGGQGPALTLPVGR